ncbi:MAG: prepilin-type N-terminal cleavage/methylation domain-containing protein [Planctomycetes bacterium]|nr:prepilin-type N-terminal cleavage/methylation domain-containing protein [Planctomycetota bacterium]
MDGHQPLLGRRRARAGFTLLEAVLSMAILTVLIVAFHGLLVAQNLVATEEFAETDLQTRLRRVMNEMVFQVEESRPLALSDDGLSFTYVLPLKATNGQIDWSSTGAVAFGTGDMGNHVAFGNNAAGGEQTNATYTIKFVKPGDPEAAFVPPIQTISEAAVQEDLNKDGDSTDTFTISSLVFMRNDQAVGAGNPRVLAGRCCVELTGGVTARVFNLDSEPFVDKNDNNIYDKPDLDTYTDANNNGRWDAKLEIQIMAVDPREKKGRVRVVKTKINYFRNSV